MDSRKLVTILAVPAVGILIAACIALAINDCHRHFGTSLCGDDDKAFHIIRDDILRSVEADGELPQ